MATFLDVLIHLPGYFFMCILPLAANDFTPTANAECEKIHWEEPATPEEAIAPTEQANPGR